MLKRGIERIGEKVIGAIEEIGQMTSMLVSALVWMVRPPFRVRVIFQNFESVGVGSLFIVLLTGLFAGLVLAYQSDMAFRMFNAETLVGATVAISLLRELGPVFTGLMVAGRTGSAMTTELGTMRVTEQIDAMSVMAVNPIQYLVMPRVLATTLMVPVLNMLFNLVGIGAAYVLSVWVMNSDPGIFLHHITRFISGQDFLFSSIKAASFGLIIGLVGCYKGFYASGGAKGVGEATTSSVVTSSITILLVDYALTLMMWSL
ncbi:ABC transporter permease [Lujinxingia litoralis]|uniref:ABC transporter permease n=1 Tax=Lujinxingia litoralis TaxID=2211119 RepID=A0A328C3X9_9DELT|nr:ABC transporter permease [Lujinxingia litoralis]RAL21692.1 ABC transporter permease [Lujinxingia litoralis]